MPRSFFKEHFWKEQRAFTKAEAVIYLYAQAAFAPHQKLVDGKLVDVEMGEVAESVRYLAEAWGWAKSSVHDFLKKLEKAGQISCKTRTGMNVIKVTFSATYYEDAEKSRTPAGHQPDKEEEGNKGKEEKEEKRSVPPLSNLNGINNQNPVIPGTPAFTLLQRIGKAAAQIWEQGEAGNLFEGPERTDLALTWLQCRCEMGKPVVSHIEVTQLATLFNANSPADIRFLIEYSAGKYPHLYPDQLAKKRKKEATRAEIIKPDRFAHLKVDASGLVKY